MTALSRSMRAARYLSLAAATSIALSCGTNYVYSAYAPQLAEKLGLSATESNVIGTLGNLGMYASGIPAGMLVDSRGHRIPILIGAAAMFIGYYPIYWAYEHGKGSMSVAALAFFSAVTGMGSCFAFMAAIKVAALNFPAHRGTATALPLAAFGLSAFFFSTLSSHLFPGNTGDFILVLGIATSSIILVSFFFIRVVPVPGTYSAVPEEDPDLTRGTSSRMHRRKSSGSHRGFEVEPGTKATDEESQLPHETASASTSNVEGQHQQPAAAETSSILTSSSSSSSYGAMEPGSSRRGSMAAHGGSGGDAAHEGDGERGRSGAADEHHGPDIRGWALTRKWEFWRLWCLLSLLTGTGLMTINNIGHSVQALWYFKDPEVDPHFVQKQQALHVSILSLCSFAGRLCSGILSDVLKRKYQLSRLWQVLASSAVFLMGQVAGTSVSNPHLIWLISGLNGYGYGIVFGVYPTIISEAFGVLGLSQNWGTMTLAPVLSGNVFNLFYGSVYDSHSTRRPKGDMECNIGVDCYRASYGITSVACLLGLFLCLFCIHAKREETRGRSRFRD